MATEEDVWRKNEWGPPSWISLGEDFDAIIVTTATSYSEDPSVPTGSIETTSMPSPTQSIGDDDSDDETQTGSPRKWPNGHLASRSSPLHPFRPVQMTNIWQPFTSITPTTTTPYAGDHETFSLSITDSPLETDLETASSSPISPHGGRPSDWNWSRKHANNAPLYAAAAVPVVVLVVIGVVAVVCLRKRRKRKAEAAVNNAVEEMKTQPHQAVVQPYIAPLASPPPPPTVSVSRAYMSPLNHLPPTSTSSEIQPIILGPIVSFSNGAYLTGMDTSDMVSINSNPQRPVDPFSDNSSLAEPPPPYRSHSSAPPSFTTNSRHSSLRVPATPHITERSPFDDPDDDTVSERSGPTLGRDDDTVSVVSDVSPQREPYTSRYSP